MADRTESLGNDRDKLLAKRAAAPVEVIAIGR
jgi:hypothetical protein